LQKWYIAWMQWSVEILNATVRAELEDLPEDMQASFLRIARLIVSKGLTSVHEPFVKHLEGRLWEMRFKGREGIARAAYVPAIGRRVIVVRVFRKKTEKTQRREIEIALNRARDLK
jgi:phage-related protein